MTDDVQIKVGFVPDTASNARTIQEAEKVRQKILDAEKAAEKNLNAAARGASALQKELANLARGAELQKIGTEFGNIAKKTGDVGKAVADLTTRLKAMSATEGEIKGVAGAFDRAQSGAAGGTGGTGGGSFQVNKLRGAASMFGGGEIVGFVDDIQDAIEGVTSLGSNLSSVLNPATIGAGIAVAALALVIQDFAKGAQEQADAIQAEFEAQRSVFDEIAGGATSDDIREQIAQLQFRRELEKTTLQEATDAYVSYEAQIRESFGVVGDIVLGFLRIIDPREEALNAEKEKSQKNIAESEARERAYNDALEKGLTAKADAKQAEEGRQKAAEKAQKEQEAADRKAQQEADKAQREAEARAKEQAQLAQQQEDMAIKNADAIKKIGQTALDGVEDINRKARDSAIDGRNKLITDLNSLAQKASDDEIGAAIKANRAEQAAFKEHQKAIADILDKAADAEENAREQRNFIEFARAQRESQKELNKQPGLVTEGRSERETALQQEREDRLRALELARRDRQQAYGEEEAQRQSGMERALRDGQIARTRQLRDQASGYQQEQTTFQRHLQGMLGLRGQFQNAEMQMLQGALNAVTGGGSRPAPAAPSSVFNNSQTINNSTIAMTTIGMGGALSMLRAAGFAR